jgi:putative ABC transport system substrate-binding protein
MDFRKYKQLVARFLATLACLVPLGLNAGPGGEPFKVFMVIHRTGAEADVGFKEYLESSGLDVEFVIRNADNSQPGSKERTQNIVEEIRRTQPDLVYTQSTKVTSRIVGRLGEIDPDAHIVDIPVVFAMVSRPINSKLVPPPASESSSLLSGRNLTGAIHVVPRRVQLNAMFAYMAGRQMNKLAVVYDPSSDAQRDMYTELSALTQEAGISLVASTPLNDLGERDPERIVPMIAEVAAEHPDMLYIPPVTFFAPHSELLTSEALKHGLPTFCAIEVQLNAKGMIGLVAPFYQVGALAGYKAEQILRGTKKPSEIPIETLSRFTFIVNLPIARQLNLFPPMEILRYAKIINGPSI